jgi:D-glycero-D-manno-heptose 1,7-bisphosphate phosphatase
MDVEFLNYKLAIFDIDGTLTEIKPALRKKNPRLVTPNHLGEQQPISGVIEKLAVIKDKDIKLALATNRGGVAFGYTTLEEAKALAREAADLCLIPHASIYVCPYHAKARGRRAVREFARESVCRKPNAGMLLQAADDYGITPEQAFFVGDRDTDQQAAKNAGMDFFWASEFFR